jgi:ABC-type antimicrobial peptide transport system permease subunit
MIGGFSLSAVSLQLIKSELHDVKTYDPATFSAVLVLLIFASLLATFLPTRRIARIDPGCHLAGGITSLAAKF